MTDDEIISSIALTLVPGVGALSAHNLINLVGSAKEVFLQRTSLPQMSSDIPPRIVELLNCPQAFQRAESEYQFAQNKQINCIPITDAAYPSRLRECPDAPIMLFYKGNAKLNPPRVINIVGTRNATEYGQRVCKEFVADLKELCPEILIMSGLAYGIDIYAHRAALSNNLPTIGV